MSDFISCGVAMSEPERLGYTTYLECIKSLLSFSDEVVVILSRKEESSEEKIRQLKDDRIRVINTETWPAEGWDYDTVCEHFQMIVDECIGDYVFKVDPDRVFRSEYGENIRNLILNDSFDKHWIDFGRVNFSGNDRFKFYNIGDWGLNIKLLESDGIDYKIENKEMQVMPSLYYDWMHSGCNDNFNSGGSAVKRFSFYSKDEKNAWLMPVNYDCTFRTKEQITSKYRTFIQAVQLSYPERKGREDLFDPFTYGNDEEVLKAWVDYTFAKMNDCSVIKNFHPLAMNELIKNISEDMWGHSNFGKYKG